MMRKIIKKLGIALLTVSLLSSATMLTSFASEVDEPFILLEEQGFQIITSHSTYSLENFDVNNIDSNTLFDKQTFESILSSQPTVLSRAIYSGNIIAVFDDSNEFLQYEKTIGLPLGFERGEVSIESTHKAIGYIYQSDEFGGIHITRINIARDMSSDEENIYTFADVLSNYEVRSSIVGVQARSELNTEFLGSVMDYYYDSDEKGDVSVAYEVSTVQGVDNYDYYVVHGYIDATPGRALYGNKYDADILTTSLSTSTSGANLYKTGPNTLSETTSYTVDIGFTFSKEDGLVGGANFSWDRSIPDVDINKTVKSSKECEWEVDICDWASAAQDTLSFEPGGTFRVAESNNRLSVCGYTEFTVDAWNESPSIATLGFTFFYCSGDTVEE